MSLLEIKWFLPALLVAGGVVVMLAAATIYRRGQQALKLIDQIYALNQQCEQDLLCFLDKLPGLLTPLQGFAGLEYKLDWYGQPLSAQAGQTSRYSRAITEIHTDAQLTLTLYWLHKPVAERWVFQEVLVRTLSMLARMNILIKQQSQSEAQRQASRSMLFLKHDIKNLAQFIQLQNTLLERTRHPASEKTFTRIVRSSALAQRQADEILLRLEPADSQALNAEPIALAAFCQQKADAFGIQLTVQGDGEVLLPASVLDTVLENLYSNALQHGKVTALALDIQSGYPLVIELIQQTPIPAEKLARIFEPLSSQTGEKGRGIGMYHCRELLHSYQADIKVASDDSGTVFKLMFIQ